jgi:hypothetical protein
METTQRRTASVGDLSDSESEIEAECEEEVATEDAANEQLINVKILIQINVFLRFS